MSFPLLLDLHQAAALVGFSSSSLRHWTYGHKPAPAGWPATVHVGRNVRYRRADLEAWVANLGNQATSPPAAAGEVRRRGRPRKIGEQAK